MGKAVVKRLGIVIVAGCALALAACGGGSPSSCGAPGTAPNIPAFAMVNPSPGATAVPDNITALLFSGTPESSTKIVLSANGATVATITSLTPVPEPTQPPEYEALLPSALSAHTTYSVIYEYTVAAPAGSACGAAGYTQSLGSFTTQ